MGGCSEPIPYQKYVDQLLRHDPGPELLQKQFPKQKPIGCLLVLLPGLLNQLGYLKSYTNDYYLLPFLWWLRLIVHDQQTHW
ncbi:hypothetical protein D3C72_619290 [compost metagenome]